MSDDAEVTDPQPTRRGAPPPPPRRGRGARLVLVVGLMGALTIVGASVGGYFLLKEGLRGETGVVVNNAFLEVELDGDLPDAPGDVGFAMDPADFPLILTEVAADIRRAATDTTVKGLYLDVGGFGGGWAGAQELHDAIAVFSASEKPCYAYADAYDNKAYYIASACKEVYLAPAGLFLVNGFDVTSEYYTGIFEKLGVHADFEHVGDFKSAVEPLQRTGPSEAAALAMDGMLDSLYEQFVGGIATARGMTPDQVRAFIDNPPVTPDAALAAGVVTGLKYRDEVREGMAGEERTRLKAYHAKGLGSAFATGKTIAVVYAEGQIISGESGSPVFGGQMIGDLTVLEILEDVRKDDDVAAVVLRVNSPGGSGLASDNIWRGINRLKESGKPVVVSMGDYAASGGYYIAANADKIVAEPGTLTGSIGVFGGKMNISGLYEKVGITLHTYKRGEMATLFSSTSDFSDPERAKFREFLEGFYKTFVTRVSEGRKMPYEGVHAVAQGRVWTGVQAKERGLVDELGGLDVAIASARTLAQIPEGDSVIIERLPKRRTFVEQLVEDLQQTRAPVELAVVPELRDSYAALYMLSRVLEDGGVAAMLPGRITIR